MRYIVLAVLLGGLARFASHVLSGYVFFSQADVAAIDNLIFSITYNGTYMVPSIIICAFLMVPIYVSLKFKMK